MLKNAENDIEGFMTRNKKSFRIKEHPVLRFQWESDLRKFTENNLRYKKSKSEQLEYKKELGKYMC